ncbi:MAG: hypothetical protein RML56_12005 [Burkholderiales bacterium]|nr:hypothetical protein [Burkholderiales bacterium]
MAKLSSTSFAASTERSAAESFCTTAAGVPTGATRKTLGDALKPGSVSAIAGHSGTLGMRAGLVTASARIFPPLAAPCAASALTTPICTCPLIRSGIIAAAPL